VSTAPPNDPRIALIVQKARTLGLDPEAVLAIDRHEGLSGGIGDSGHAFGPGQMNNAGGVLTGKFSGMSPKQINAWAWSPAGIDYYLKGVSKVARGLKGRAAITAIASRYERPADIPAEISDALAHYGSMGAGAGRSLPSPPATSASGGNIRPMGNARGGDATRQQLLASMVGGMGQIDFGSNQVQPPNLMALMQMRQQMQSGGPVTPPTGAVTSRGTAAPSAPAAPAGAALPAGGVPFLGDTTGVNSSFLAKVSAAAKAAGATHIRVTSGYRSPEHNASVGGVQHSNHTMGHALDGEAYFPGRGWVPLGQALLPVVGKFGLRSGDVPGFYHGGTDPVHVDDGWNLSH
jgi:hypothetical protein